MRHEMCNKKVNATIQIIGLSPFSKKLNGTRVKAITLNVKQTEQSVRLYVVCQKRYIQKERC